MGSLMFEGLVFVCGYLMVCDGHLNDVIKPCGPRLCDYLCDSLTACSSHAYQAKSLVCVLRNRSQDEEGGVKECNNVTTRRGKRVSVCTERGPRRKESVTDGYGTTLKPGDAVLIFSDPQQMEAIYIGNGDFVMLQMLSAVVTKRSISAIKDDTMRYNVEAGHVSVFDRQKIVQRAVSRLNQDVSPFSKKDFISWCVNGLAYNNALRKSFSFQYPG